MGCGGCGSGSILPGTLSARNREKPTRVRGYSGSGILRAKKKAAKEAEEVKASSADVTLPSNSEPDIHQRADEAQKSADELSAESLRAASEAALK